MKEMSFDNKPLSIICWLVGWLFMFYGISTFVSYLTSNPFFIQIIRSVSNNSI